MPAFSQMPTTVPAIVTNIWQTFGGPYLRDIIRRLWPLMIGTVVGIWLNSGMLTGPYARFGPMVLGALLVIYAVLGLGKISFHVARSNEKWIGGIVGLVNKGQLRKPDDWGALRAWAWGTSRLLDYLETDHGVDARHVAIEGHSRFGKTALVAMAYDSRFAVAYVNSSGAGGADLARRHYGEQLENIAGTGEYHWMDGNYLKSAESSPREITPADMPVDTHELIALCAPRPVFIGGGTTQGGDGWADVRGTFIAEVAAGPVYKLLGAKDLGTETFPPIGTALISGELGFRQHPGGHTPLPDFPTFITFASRYMSPE